MCVVIIGSCGFAVSSRLLIQTMAVSLSAQSKRRMYVCGYNKTSQPEISPNPPKKTGTSKILPPPPKKKQKQTRMLMLAKRPNEGHMPCIYGCGDSIGWLKY